jgi:Zn-dependent oligopeptidase
MKYCSDRQIRKDFETARNTFASSGKYDNRPIVLELLKLKRQKAKLLGYKNYAELSLNDKMADSPEQVLELIGSINKKAKKKALQEISELKEYFHLDELESYDLSYYSTKLKEEKYELDDKELKKYFEFENVLSYLHKLVQEFYGIEVKEIIGPPLTPPYQGGGNIDFPPLNKGRLGGVYNEDVRVYEIYKDGKFISYYFLDPFYRKTKRPGAWADDIRNKLYDIPEQNIHQKVPIVVNVCNFQKNESGKTTLSLRDVETIFHEFGHAIHEILSESKHSELS